MTILPRPTLRVSALVCCLAVPWGAHAQDADRVLGPIRLVRPLSPHTIEMLYKEADSAYRGERWTAAMQGFRTLVGYEPAHGRAWFRIGNLHQQRRQLVAAAGAYRRATAAIDPTAPDVPAADAAVRNKALLNLAFVNAELARDALAQLEPSSDEEASVLTEARAHVGELHDDVLRRTRPANPASAGRDWPDPTASRPADHAGPARRSALEVQTGSVAPEPMRYRSTVQAPPPPVVGGHAAGLSAPSAPVYASPRSGSVRLQEPSAPGRAEAAANAASWARRPAMVPAAPNEMRVVPNEMRAPAPVFVPAAGSSDRPVLRTSAERGWVERYDDEPEVRPQIEYLRGVPRQ